MNLSVFEKSYIETMLWSSIDPETEKPLDENFSVEDFSDEALAQIKKDCAEFQAGDQYSVITNDLNDVQIAHDFWLTRNHHGAGFFDGDYPKKVENFLMERTKKFPELTLYVGDDKKLYFM
jgi:hypothetical protein